MKKILFISSLLFIFTVLSAQVTEPVLEQYPSSIGEGSSGNIIDSDDCASFFYNPAAAMQNRNTVMYEHKFLMGNISQYNSVFLNLPFSTVNVGLGYVNQLISRIPIYPEYPSDPDSVSFNPEGYFSDISNVFMLNAAYRYAPSYYSPYVLRAGINVKYIYHTIYDKTGMGAGIDAGLAGDVDFGRLFNRGAGTLSLLISLNDIGGTAVKWNTDSEHSDSRGMQFRADLVYANTIFDNYYTQIELNYKSNNDALAGIGALARLNSILSIYAGTDIDSGFSFIRPGVGASVSLIGFDIAYGISRNGLGVNHSVSVKYSL